MKTCFIHRLGAFGDLVHSTHLPRLIKEHYKVDRLDFETSVRGHIALDNNPYIDNLILMNHEETDRSHLIAKWRFVEDEYDLVFNLIHSIELEYCCNETDQKYFRNTEYRRKNCGETTY